MAAIGDKSGVKRKRAHSRSCSINSNNASEGNSTDSPNKRCTRQYTKVHKELNMKAGKSKRPKNNGSIKDDNNIAQKSVDRNEPGTSHLGIELLRNDVEDEFSPSQSDKNKDSENDSPKKSEGIDLIADTKEFGEDSDGETDIDSGDEAEGPISDDDSSEDSAEDESSSSDDGQSNFEDGVLSFHKKGFNSTLHNSPKNSVLSVDVEGMVQRMVAEKMKEEKESLLDEFKKLEKLKGKYERLEKVLRKGKMVKGKW